MEGCNESGRRGDGGEFLERGEVAACASLLRSATPLGEPEFVAGLNRPAAGACGRVLLDQRLRREPSSPEIGNCPPRRRVQVAECRLEDLLACVRKDNLHEEVDTGDAVCREAW
jgi:hypothetical protein